MVGFGFMDNLVMIQAGEYIDSTIGVTMGLSTLTAAAYGQVVSDVSGTLFGSTVDAMAAAAGLPAAGLTRAQLKLRNVRMVSTSSAVVGVVIGCLLGMTSLFFMDLDKSDRLKKQRELRTLFATLMEDGHRLIGAERCLLFLVDADGHHLFRLSAKSATPPQKDALRRTFEAYDTSHSGTISSNELMQALVKQGWQPDAEQVQQMMAAADVDADGELSFDEFTFLITKALLADEVRLAVRDGGTRHHVLESGELLNVADASNHPLCSQPKYQLRGYDVRNLLIGPILDADGKVIGLVELVNKDPSRNEGTCFSRDDEKLLGMLCSHCSIFITQLEEASS
tara:strand:+ start:479 stop:1495 length:1017 start_codon:yes stop_codon:yes gene_type:complete